MPDLAEKYDFSFFEGNLDWGNTAPALPEEEVPSRVVSPKKKVKQTVKPVVRKKRNYAQIAMGIVAFIIVTGLAGLLVEKNVELTTLTNQIEITRQEIKLAEATEQQLQLKLEEKFNSIDLAKYAKQELGMYPITRSQIVYINKESEDKGTIHQPVEEKYWFEKVIDYFSSLFCIEYE